MNKIETNCPSVAGTPIECRDLKINRVPRARYYATSKSVRYRYRNIAMPNGRRARRERRGGGEGKDVERVTAKFSLSLSSSIEGNTERIPGKSSDFVGINQRFLCVTSAFSWLKASHGREKLLRLNTRDGFMRSRGNITRLAPMDK